MYKLDRKSSCTRKTVISSKQKKRLFRISKVSIQKKLGRPDRDTHIRGPFAHDSGHDADDPNRQVGFVVHVEKYS